MKQQINLLVEKQRGPREPLSLLSLLALAVLASLALYALSWGAQYAAEKSQQQAATLEQRSTELPVQIARLEQAYANPMPAPELIEAQKALRQDIAGRKHLIQLLTPIEARLADASQGFTPYLYGLAESAQDGIWLTGFELDLPSAQVRLQGATRRAELVPVLLQSVGQSTAFSGLVVKEFLLEQNSGSHLFDVRGQIASQGGDHGG